MHGHDLCKLQPVKSSDEVEDSMPRNVAQDVTVVEYYKLVECSMSDQPATEDQVLLAQQIQQVRVLSLLTALTDTTAMPDIYPCSQNPDKKVCGCRLMVLPA